MVTATKTIEIYNDKVHSAEGMVWFFVLCNRFLKVACRLRKKMTVMVGNDYYFVINFNDLEVAKCQCMAHINFLLRNGGVCSRVTFTAL